MASQSVLQSKKPTPPSFGKGLTSKRSMAQLLHLEMLYPRAMLHGSTEATPMKVNFIN